MDLRFGDSEPTDDERAAVDALLGPPESFWEGGERTEADLRWTLGTRNRRHLLLPGLHAINDRVGWISPGALTYLCRRLTVPPAEAYGVATFYPMFSVEPRPTTVLRVCTDLACTAAGAADVCAGIEDRLDRDAVRVERVSCLGLCERAPAALVIKAGDPVRTAVSAPTTAAAAILAANAPDSAPEEPPPAAAAPQTGRPAPHTGRPTPQTGRPARQTGRSTPQTDPVTPPTPDSGPPPPHPALLLLNRVGVVDPSSLDDYRAHGGYTALRRAFALGPAGVVREVVDSGLVGRGGAASPTGPVWQAVASSSDLRHHLVCNAAEAEPGTFKDRVLMEGDPYALVEAMTIAAYAIGAHHGHLYLRGEYPRAADRMQHAIARARARGLLGDDVLGRGFAFDIEIRRGAGAYVCGEETALLNSVEGHRGEPRSTPPFPAEKGLFGGPTVVNNVETLVNVLPVLTMGAAAYAAIGTARCTGTKLFSVSGSVARPGVYELPFGTPLRALLSAAGVRENLRAVLLGGAAGGFLRPDELDLPLSYEDSEDSTETGEDGTRSGTTLGSGAVLALDGTVPLPRLLLRIAEFFRAESCGQCVPCRVGTVRQEEALRRIVERTGAAAADDLTLLADVGRALRDASLCGLGRSAWDSVESAVRRLGAYR